MTKRAVGFLMQEPGLSERRSCRIVGRSRSVQQYQPVPKNDAAVIERLKKLASENRRYGYLRHAVLRREGRVVNRERTYRLLHRSRPPGPHQDAAQAAAAGPDRAAGAERPMQRCRSAS
jgi:hypothetical protein